MIKFIRPWVRTIGGGWVASAGALIFVGADVKDRYCLPNTRLLLYQLSAGIGGRASDMEIQAEQIWQMRSRFEAAFTQTTGQTAVWVRTGTKRDFWLNTKAALAYGVLGWGIASVTGLS